MYVLSRRQKKFITQSNAPGDVSLGQIHLNILDQYVECGNKHTQKITSVFSLFLNGRAITHTHTQRERRRGFLEPTQRVGRECVGGQKTFVYGRDCGERRKKKNRVAYSCKDGRRACQEGRWGIKEVSRREEGGYQQKTGGYRSCSAGVLHDSTVGSQVVC